MDRQPNRRPPQSAPRAPHNANPSRPAAQSNNPPRGNRQSPPAQYGNIPRTPPRGDAPQKSFVWGGQNVFWLCAAVCALALVLRACFGGVNYLPVLDDTVQYFNYPSALDYGKLIEQEGLLASRPLAGLTDLYITGQMNRYLILPVLFLSVMHGFSAALFSKLFHKYFGTSPFFAVLFALIPLGCEGTYWLSAATRIVPGLFFTACAANVLDDFLKRGQTWRLPLYAFLQLLAMSFYEQILVLTVTLAGLQFLTFVRTRSLGRRSWAAWLTFAALAVYFGFTGYHAAQGALGSRIGTVFPTTWEYYKPYMEDVFHQISAAFLKGGARTLFKGLLRGFTACASSLGGVIYLFFAVLLCFGFLHFVYSPREFRFAHWGVAIVWGVLLTVAPWSPYFIINNPYFSLRACVPSFLGLALLIDLLLRAVIRNPRALTVVTAICIPVFLVASASEIADYKGAAAQDEKIAAVFLEHTDELYGNVCIFGLPEYYRKDEQNYPYHEHIALASSSGWALYAKLVCEVKETNGEESFGFTLNPLPTDTAYFYHDASLLTNRISNFDQVWYWDAENAELVQLTVVSVNPDNWMPDHYFYLPDDPDPLCRVWEEGWNYGYFRWLK